MILQEDTIPKVFISYSWSSDVQVLELAQRLVSHGINVVIDKWDLKEGQDKYAFMERCVNESEITKVLIICDKAYAQKANNRTGGVGDETVIISSEIYGNIKQEKFIPVIAEKDEEGKPYVPTYIKTRIYIDLSDPDTYEEEYEKLLRNVYEKPQFMRPKLGKRPEWIDEEKTDFFPLKDLIRQIRGSNTDNKRKNCISRFQSAYIEVLKVYFEKGAAPERMYEIFLNTKPIRDIFLDFVEVIAETESDYAEILAECFEAMYNQLTCIKTFDPNAGSVSDNDLDVFKNHVWELFICVIAFMRHVKDYMAINVILTYTYFLETSVFGGSIKQNNYTAFRHHSHVVEECYKPKTEMKNKYTLMGDTICNQREKLPIYSGEAIAEADLFLYQVCNAYDLADSEQSWHCAYWFPTCYVYTKSMPIEWGKMKSRRYCEKMMILFGVDSLDDLKAVVRKCAFDDKMKYSGSWDAAPAILNCIKVEDIGTLS
ncbi:toll/interleukin-1 receptor domain-containing protein [Anaerocolumna chitinilytica]|uniref:toll/interleukin-1 receptor domain-containing protein n=1 Tax=Anaerocolumna chitinilytica TaxID=1727145 RepID=UPI001CED2A90|nr:toll/interleukin-1 receptor domain-containing protein [Anaerocolumna chitinilytica]